MEFLIQILHSKERYQLAFGLDGINLMLTCQYLSFISLLLNKTIMILTLPCQDLAWDYFLLLLSNIVCWKNNEFLKSTNMSKWGLKKMVFICL